MDETDIQDELRVFWQQQAEIAVANFRRKRVQAEYLPDRHAARERILSLIPPGASIGCGDSVTIQQIGVLPLLIQSNNHEILNPFDKHEDGGYKVLGEERIDLERRAMMADVFLSGANAVTLDGRVVATDGNGNRVAAMIYGPRKIIIVAGVNKLVPDLQGALNRIRQIAAPANFRRHADKHHRQAYYGLPCVKSGRCVDCAHEERGCNYTIIIEGGRIPSAQYPAHHRQRHNILLVGESLGI